MSQGGRGGWLISEHNRHLFSGCFLRDPEKSTLTPGVGTTFESRCAALRVGHGASPQVADGQRGVSDGHQGSSLVQVQDGILFIKDLQEGQRERERERPGHAGDWRQSQ